MSLKNIEDVYPLSPMQQGMLFHSIYAPQSDVYIEQTYFELHGELNVTAFTQAWQQVIARHPLLRSACVWEKLEKPLQVVGRQVQFPWQELDWREMSPVDQRQNLEAFLQRERQRGFILSKAPLMYFSLIRLAEKVYHFCWSHHHILLDGWSGAIIYKEVIAYYKAYCEGKSLYLGKPHPYRDYIAWLQQQNISEAEVFWRKTFSGFTSPTQLRTNVIAGYQTQEKENGYGEQQLRLSHTTTADFYSFVKQHQLTLNTLVQAAWAFLLSRYSGEQDVVFGATVSGRPTALADVESMVGLFINTLPVRVRVSPKQELLSWLQQLLAQQVETRQYEYTSLVDIHKWSDIPAGLPLFESIVVFENYPLDETFGKIDLNVKIKNINIFEKTNYPLTLIIVPGRELLFKILYQKSERFNVFTINKILEHLLALLKSMVAKPYQLLEQLPLLTSDEQQLLVKWNGTQIHYSQQLCIHQLFEAQVERTPDAIAVVFEKKQLTYRELNIKANQLAHYLRSLGVKPEVLVGISVERSLDMVVGLLAILKAGGAYVPLDPSYPQERLAFMLSDSQVQVLLTQQHLIEKLPKHEVQIICLDTNLNIITQQSQDNPISSSEADNLAYVIYTSGSTGQPKGVCGLHKGAINRFQWMWQNYPFVQEEICCQKTSLNFVDSLWEIFGPLLQGVTTVIVPDRVVKDPQQFITTLAHNNVTRIVLVPSLLRILLKTYDVLQLQLPKLKLWVSSGEALSSDLLVEFRQSLLDSTLLNLYGSSEVSADVTCYSISPQASLSTSVLIGRPIANTQIYILDANNRPVPIGVLGEIYISGDQLARGYLNRPELTAEKFIPNPFSKESTRLYKTGDLARYLPNGEIEYIGRLDHQVKIRGLRIEIGEIESRLTEYTTVREAVVVVREDIPGDKRLVAYVVSEQALAPKLSELRSFLREKLPDYMIPTAFVPIKAMPLTPNGKVDRQSLPMPDNLRSQLETAYIKPQTDLEKSIATVWQKALKIEKVGINDNFFELGGHSLLMVQVHSQLCELFSTNLFILDLFRYPTISSLAEFINRVQHNELSELHQTDTRTKELEQGKARIKKFLKISKGVQKNG
jgi:surfactin family lipopeptide synthetase C